MRLGDQHTERPYEAMLRFGVAPLLVACGNSAHGIGVTNRTKPIPKPMQGAAVHRFLGKRLKIFHLRPLCTSKQTHSSLQMLPIA